MTQRFIQGFRAVAEATALSRPQVLSAYPITPQTGIVEELAQMVADGTLKAEFVNVESEHSAASVVLGASATGVRVYTATTSQGLLLMNEVLYNIAGMRLPVVLTCVNRAVSAPINIWNDQQDSISVRDAGILQLYAENNQEGVDLLIQAYRIAEDHRILLPVMVCMDGYILPHAYEPVDIPSQEAVDSFLPAYDPLYRLDPDNPVSMGALAEPDKYLETRYMIHKAMESALKLIPQVAAQFQATFGRATGGLVESYRMEDAEVALVTMGSLAATLKETADELRAEGRKVGVVRLIAYRPFPAQELRRTLGKARRALVLEKAISLGSEGPLALEVKAAFHGLSPAPAIASCVAGLGGRDIPVETIKRLASQPSLASPEFVDLRADVELEGVER
ncbi:MAG: pyruvate ferredoxin oxidoreductase [Chloroflexi bacterium]|nr:pyruvate ferredoxin oxidoreductase [Chloroflexota bacterium]